MSNSERYPIEPTCDSDWKCKNPDHPKDEHGYCGHPTDNGTMPENVSDLAEKVVGHRIVSVGKRQVSERHRYGLANEALVIQLDSGVEVQIVDTDDCCAHTSLESFLLHPDKVDHIITGVGTTDGYEKWHIYADMGDVLELQVGWSCGNPFYYGYGFDIAVAPIGADQ